MKKKILAGFVVSTMLLGIAPTSALAAWQENNPLVAHCMGEVDGKIETNSREAFINSWESGLRVFEVDLIYTTDNVLVARHDFTADGSYYRLEQTPTGALQMDSQTYGRSKIVYELTPLTMADLVSLMQEYSDVYLVTDTKSTDRETVQRQFRDIKAIAENMGAPEVLDRIVPQLYSKEMLGWVKEIHPFSEWIYTLYQTTEEDTLSVAQFCVDNGVGTVTMEKDTVTKEFVDIMHSQGIQVYAHTVNRYLQMESLLGLGVDGVYSDRIKPYELGWVGLSNTRSIRNEVTTIQGAEVSLTKLSILGVDYAPLRQLAPLGKGFSVEYTKESGVLAITTDKPFVSIGNEILMDQSNHLITQKAKMKVQINDKDTDLQVYLVDGEVYVPLSAALSLLGLGA